MIFRQIKKVVSACLFLLISIPVNAETIHIVPGPYGGSKINTPWGDYVAVPFGNTIWVGTVEEWMDIKAVSIGKPILYSITTNIVFGVKPSKKDKRPPKPKGAEYVIIVWVPSEAVSIKAAIAIGNQTISPNDCSTGHFSYCEFTVRKEQLTAGASIIFYSKRKSPSIINVESLAKQHFSDLSLKYKHVDGEPISDDDMRELQQLHNLDESIPLTLAGHPNLSNSTITLKICRKSFGQLDMEKFYLSSPINFTLRDRRYKSYQDRTIYSVKKDVNIGPVPSCFISKAFLYKNPTNEPPPIVGSVLVGEATATDETIVNHYEMPLEAVVIENSQYPKLR